MLQKKTRECTVSMYYVKVTSLRKGNAVESVNRFPTCNRFHLILRIDRLDQRMRIVI